MPRGHYKIILDLEFNPVRDPAIREFARHEIIEIGAVKLNDSLETVSQFSQYIRPQYNDLEENIAKLTGITPETLRDAPDFDTGMTNFMNWIGSEPFSLYSWSGSDRAVMQHEIDLKYPDDTRYDIFFVHWIDLQKIYQREMGFSKSMGLTNALGTFRINFKGTEHGALADAINTAEVMRYISSREKMEKIKRSSVTFNQASESAGFSVGSIPIKTRKRK